jgi:hypothetical protein
MPRVRIPDAACCEGVTPRAAFAFALVGIAIQIMLSLRAKFAASDLRHLRHQPSCVRLQAPPAWGEVPRLISHSSTAYHRDVSRESSGFVGQMVPGEGLAAERTGLLQDRSETNDVQSAQ